MRANAAGAATMRRLTATLLTAFVLATIPGCGQMGPLYMPAEPPGEDGAARPQAGGESTRDAA